MALVLGCVAVAATVARALLGPRIHAPIAAMARGVEVVLTRVALALVWCVAIAPVWLLRRPAWSSRRRRRAGRAGWVDPAEATAPARSRRSRWATAFQAVGLVVVLLVADVVVGVAWQRFTRSSASKAVGLHRDDTVDNGRASSPALAGDAWAAQQMRDLQHLPQAYWPFTANRPIDFSSDTIHVSDWVRRSYEPAHAEDLPVIAFYGGSTAFGEGQRDEHTIASEIARLAEEAGTPVRVVNYGQRAWVAWQEALLFDQMSADPAAADRPDLVVFYDGWNEVAIQGQRSTAGWPTIFGVDGISRSLTGRNAGTAAGDASSRSLLSDVGDWYSSRSMVFRAVRSVRSTLGDRPELPPVGLRQDEANVGRDAAAVYLRAVDVVSDTARRRGVDATFFWQPAPDWRDDEAYVTATRAVQRAGDVHVIADALDGHPEVYFDQIHTNEDGARIVAERMWRTLAPKVAAIS